MNKLEDIFFGKLKNADLEGVFSPWGCIFKQAFDLRRRGILSCGFPFVVFLCFNHFLSCLTDLLLCFNLRNIVCSSVQCSVLSSAVILFSVWGLGMV